MYMMLGFASVSVKFKSYDYSPWARVLLATSDASIRCLGLSTSKRL